MFLKPDTKVTPSLQKLSVWANSGFYKPAAVSEFLQAADYFLIAHAEAYQYIVVTHEQPSLSSKKIKIPDACDAMSVKWTSPFEMLEAEQALFVLKT